MEELLASLEVANITDVGVDIRNIGLLMFSEQPEKYLPGAQIELIRFYSPDGEGSDDFTEKIFTGPIQKQVRDALSHINAVLIEEKVVKHSERAEATRFFNYPCSALEEILVNAVFHKSYRIQEPVEIRIYVDCIKIINHPGPEKSIKMEDLKTGRAIARRYRNRRIGEFLKEIDLSDKKSTGITKILRTLKLNGSPPPEFETNDERDYLIVTIRQHEAFRTDGTISEGANEGVNEGANEGVNEGVNHQTQIIKVMEGMPNITVKQIAERIGVSITTIEREIRVMKKNDMIKFIGPKKSGYWEIMTIRQQKAFRTDETINEGISEGISEGRNEGRNRQNQIIKAMEEMPNITVKQIAQQIGVSITTIEREIRVMKKNDMIKFIGPKKSGYWEIIR